MSWILIEGIDKTGKTTVAELYKKEGYEVVHLSAPDKKYTADGYSGPSYLDYLIELYVQYDNKNVVFDRSPYGELVWPQVYGREAQLESDDFEILKEFEDKNDVERILMIDPDSNAHWQRCVEHNEPLNHHQFKVAASLFNRLAHQHNFIPRELGDFNVNKPVQQAVTEGQDTAPLEKTEPVSDGEPAPLRLDGAVTSIKSSTQDKVQTPVQAPSVTEEQAKLEKANAINNVLSKRIVKQKGPVFDELNNDIKLFLQDRLSELLGGKQNDLELTEEEVRILKVYCQRIKEKAKG